MSGIPSAAALQHMAKANAIYDRAYDAALAAIGSTRSLAMLDPNAYFQAHTRAVKAMRDEMGSEAPQPPAQRDLAD